MTRRSDSTFVPELSGRALDAVERCISERRLPNGLIICCREEKTAVKTARYLAAGAACETENRPCGVCEACRKIRNGISQDVIDVLPEEGKQSVSVDVIRGVRSDAYITPGELDIKVYIIHYADKMNSQAQNALLKVLEEPPSAVRFMLLCSNTAALLPTVRSRCWTINIPSDADRAAASGKNAELIRDTVEALAGNKRSALEGLIVRLPDDRNEYRDYIMGLMGALRDLSAERCGLGPQGTSCLEDLPRLSRLFSEAGVIRAYDSVYKALSANDANINVLTSQTSLLSDLWSAIHG